VFIVDGVLVLNTPPAVALSASRLPLDADASATPMKQELSNQAEPSGLNLSTSEAEHSNNRLVKEGPEHIMNR
jgi:hypothetical protein